MIQPIPHAEPKKLEMPTDEFERLCQNAARQSIIRNARLGFPAVSCENGQIIFSPPERVLAEFAADVPRQNVSESNGFTNLTDIGCQRDVP